MALAAATVAGRPASAATVASRARPSHRLMETRGLFWCCRCGAHARRIPRSLLRQCVGSPRSQAYRQLLKGLRRGLLPVAPSGHSDRSNPVPHKPRLLARAAVGPTSVMAIPPRSFEMQQQGEADDTEGSRHTVQDSLSSRAAGDNRECISIGAHLVMKNKTRASMKAETVTAATCQLHWLCQLLFMLLATAAVAAAAAAAVAAAAAASALLWTFALRLPTPPKVFWILIRAVPASQRISSAALGPESVTAAMCQ